MSDGEEVERDGTADDERSVEETISERLSAGVGASERQTFAKLAREIGSLPADRARVVLEVSAQLAPLSLRACAEFVRAAPRAARLLDAEDLRAWGELGRRLAMADTETGAQFFAAGAQGLAEVPTEARTLLLQVCARQMTLSTAIAVETFRHAGAVARAVRDADSLASVFRIAVEIARRSARHSADFLNTTPAVFAHFEKNFGGTDAATVAVESIRVVEVFAGRAGGMASDAWAALPEATDALTAEQSLELLRAAESFLERGGAAALHVLVAGGEVLRLAPEVFGEWVELARAIAEQGNAALVAVARASPNFFRALARRAGRGRSTELSRRVVAVVTEVARVDAEAAISCLRSAPAALALATVGQFENWAREGLTQPRTDARARRSYYALETRRSNDALRGDDSTAGLALAEVAQTLRFYVEGLTGRAVDVAALAAVPHEARINDGRTIQLPGSVAEFADDALNFRLYKVLAAHAAGQIEFGTHARISGDESDPQINHALRAAFDSLADLYDPQNLDARDAFALDGYINDPKTSERALSPEEEARRANVERERREPSPEADYRNALALFPLPDLAARVFSTLENARIDRRLRHAYRGLARDLDLVRAHLRAHRPPITSFPSALVPFELLFQIALCGGATDDARNFYSQIVSEMESIVADYLSSPASSVADTLMATARVYSLFQSIAEGESEQRTTLGETDSTEGGAESNLEQEREPESDEEGEREQQERRDPKRDARELFSAWAKSGEQEGDAEQLTGAERWSQAETFEHELGPDETAYEYDEWDRDLSDTRTGWCRVVEKSARKGDRNFVELTRTRYRGVISSIRHQFQMMKPESLTRIKNELDGDDYDLDAVIDYVADRRADGRQSERLYVRRLRRERDVAVAFLLDQSSSTARTIGRHPLQPYTHPGRRIIEIEKEGLVLMSEALEAVGDAYAIYGFTSEGRRNVKFYVVKEFGDRYNEEIERRIGGINYQHNTRLGAAVRHAATRLAAQDARTRLLIVLSDGRPYDHDYGDARYAREDTRAALSEARLSGVTPFCITIDRDSEAELRDLYGEVGYTIIDDVLSLPERMPAIYRRLTT